MKRVAILLILVLLLAGCDSWKDGEYASATPHKVKEQPKDQPLYSATNFTELKAALEQIVESGASEALVSVEDYQFSTLDNSMEKAVTQILTNHPIGAYAVESITYELGTSGGIRALAVTVNYTRNPDEVRNIKNAADGTQARELIIQALSQCESGVVIRIRSYADTDFSQIVEDFALQNPDLVMEIPQVAASVYPDHGTDRVVDIRFVFQTDRDSLRRMQQYVQPVFTSASLYVSSEEESDGVKYARLYTFLMERNDYKVETSITPAYSLLRYGVGDNRAFAVVYAAMCRKAGLDCRVVTGTHNGEARFWNIICEDGVFYHVDLLSPGGFQKLTDQQMNGYVWDYSAYPVCGVPAEEEVTE